MPFTPTPPPLSLDEVIAWTYRNLLDIQGEFLGGLDLSSTLIVSSDAEMLTVVNPSLDDDVLLQLNDGVPGGLVKLNDDNQVPIDHLPLTGLQPQGPWDPDPPPGGDGPDPPAAGNTPGDFYVFSNGGVMNLREASDPFEHPVDVVESDQMIYFEPASDPNGWYYIPNLIPPHEHPWTDITDTPVFTQRWPTYAEVTAKPATFPPDPHGHAATEISYDPAGSDWGTSTVQAVLDEISARATLRDREELVGERWDFGAGINLANAQILHGRQVVGTPQPIAYVDGFDQVILGGSLLNTVILGTTVNVTPAGEFQYNGANVAIEAAFTTRWPTYAEVTDKPLTFPPDPHTHDLATEITGLTNLISTDAQLITVLDPSIATDTTLQLHVGVPDGLVKLNDGGFVPVEHLPFTGLDFLGEWHPIIDGATPPATIANGDFYVFNAAGNMTLLTSDNQTPHTVLVSSGDIMVTILGSAGFVDGWYYLPRQFPSSIPASAVTYDPQFARWVSTDVQQTLDEISGRAALIAEAESISGAWRFTAGLEWLDVINTPVFTQRWPTYAEVTGKPATFPPDPHTHDYTTDITGKPATFPPSPHTHLFADITDPPVFTLRWPTYAEVTDKPLTFPPAAHTHPWTEITATPIFTQRWPTWEEVTGKPLTFPPTAHTHTASEIIDLPPPGTVVTRFESAPIPWAQAGSVPHGLGRLPDGYKVQLRCAVNNNGWLVGDLMDITNLRINNDGSKGGWINATTIGWATMTINVNSFTPKLGASGSFTNTQWGVVLRAWIYT